LQPVRFGVAYFGVRDFDHARDDMADMADQGIDWVLLPMTQDDGVWETRTFRGLVDLARDAGIVPVISLWGGGEFGGEGIEGPLSVGRWVEAARATGAPILHLDEPKNRSLGVPGVLDLWGDDASAWLTIEPYRVDLFPRDAFARPAVVGTDAYTGSVDDRVQATSRFRTRTRRLDLAWVEAFRIREGTEAAVGEAVLAMASLSPNVGVWGWKGSTGRGDLRSDRPAAVQEAVAEAIAAYRSSDPAIRAA
jgi:hypothetical protein